MLLVFDGDLELDTSLFEVRRGGVAVSIEPQAFDVLAYLAAHRDRVVAKEELMDAVWGGRFVSETAVTSRIKQVRRALGDDGQAQRLIRTQHGRGYRFVAPVEVRGDSTPAPDDSETAAGSVASGAGASSGVATSSGVAPISSPGASGATAPIRYTVSDGLQIAYQVSGGGDIDIVLASGFVSHLELDWADPRHAHFLDRLGSLGRLIRFDKRGTGMSDRPPDLPDLETRMHDLLAVMDAVGSRRAVLVGYSEGGPMCLLFAASHPERVSSLILYGSYAKRTAAEGYPWGQQPEDRARYTDHLVMSWDWEADLRMRCPSADAPMQRWWAQRMRAAATPSTIRALMDMNSLVDVRDVLGAVRVPTLVLHRTGDALFQTEEARYLAEHIPGARLQLLEGRDHFVSGNPDQLLDAMEPFVREQARPVAAPAAATALAAVAAPGGQDGAQLSAQLVAGGGRRGTGPSGRPVVLFDGPATAVRVGLSALGASERLGLAIAEIPRDATQLDAYGVQIALKLADAAPPGSLWVSGPVRDLLAGSGVALEPAGDHSLGVLGPQPVFRALATA